ncbi:dTMP kinase [Woeseia oceani]|uniref:Thymidylate kinase n=1 Tax=Woeseia oceani TaxID=1548547 RepID=A0A193LGA6_9GAMM|nr:dTMP kinase [Woeseia oceani]
MTRPCANTLNVCVPESQVSKRGRGKFITVEGGEGVGKSTNIDFMAALIEEQGYTVVRTREPGGTPMAERIRGLLLEHGEENLPDTAELLLFFAARTLNIENAIKPALAAGQWVLCDRFTDASRAYQGCGRGLDTDKIETLASWVHADVQPDLTVLLDAPPAIGMQRAQKRGAADRLESEHEAFYTRVRDGYLAIAAREPERFAVIDASRTLDEVQQQIGRAMGRFF